MAVSPRYTVRLSPALGALVQEHIRGTGTPFAVLIRDALAAYLADTAPTGAPTHADSADTVRHLQEQLTALTTRMEGMEATMARVRQLADRFADIPADSASTSADRPLTPADRPADREADRPPTAQPGQRRPGRPSSLRPLIIELLHGHPEGLTATQIKVFLSVEKNIGDTLSGMTRNRVINKTGTRPAVRYVLPQSR